MSDHSAEGQTSSGTNDRIDHDAEGGAGVDAPGNEADAASETESRSDEAGRFDADGLKGASDKTKDVRTSRIDDNES